MSRFAGVLGLNRRELELIAPKNPRDRMIQIAQSKVNTKRLLEANDIPVPKTYAVLSTRRELSTFAWELPDDFALKPSGGGRGCGIVVMVGRHGDGWRTLSGRPVPRRELAFHVIAILTGDFSREARSDVAHFEQRLSSSLDITGNPTTGLPDVRVIVCDGRPLMAMSRIPTLASDGKANLHQGAVGVGIDIPTGLTTHAVHDGQPCTQHPDTKHDLIGARVPHWERFLDLAMRAAVLSGLGYTGVDLVLDDGLGPAILEINARPGLNIQIANLTGLRDALTALKVAGS